tara:strand:+ start:1198 stop:1617 length:420 start_codon:yes stop_codon:yes gene_type:complete
MKIKVGQLRQLLRESSNPKPLQRRIVTVEGHEVDCEVADTDASRMRGLMHREELPQGTGMLFVFPWADQQSFWMRDTHIPLDVAFADPRGKILNIETGQPLSERRMLSQGSAMYVLEVPKGWFAFRGLGPGSILSLTDL